MDLFFRQFCTTLFSLFFLSFFSPAYAEAPRPEADVIARADIVGTDPDSKLQGTVLFEEVSHGLYVTVQVYNAPPGDHAIHIHQFGDIGNKGLSTGGHYNPQGAPHGFIGFGDWSSAHPGDFGNITVDEQGSGSLALFVPGLRVASGPATIGGRAVIIHDQPDDFSQPTGNAGSRIAAGVIIVVKEGKDSDKVASCCAPSGARLHRHHATPKGVTP